MAQTLQIWVVREERLGREDVAAMRDVLGEAERERAARYRRAGDRLRSVVARGIARHALTRFEPARPPESWEIVNEADGRPVAVDGPWFSVTHTAGLIAVAVGDVRVGVDAEDVTRSTDVDAVGRRWLHPDEYAAIDVAGQEERRRRFFEIWTVKEAYSKALGLGLKLGLKTFRVTLDDPVQVDSEEGSLDDWTFQTFAPTGRHCLAIAVERPDASFEWVSWPDDLGHSW